MKPPREWDEDYLLNLPANEATNIEFKGRRGLDLTLSNVNENHVKEELSVSLSAFANSGGGLIIFGVKNPNPDRALEIDDGGIDLSMKGRSTTKEWLEDVIPHLTDHPLPSFEVHSIKREKEVSQILENRAVFLIEIPDSERAPHQATDRRYYIRAGGKSQPANHIFVMDIAARRQYPIVQLELRIQSNLEWSEEEDWQVRPPDNTPRKADFLIAMVNRGRVYAQYVNGFIYIPKRMVKSEVWGNENRKIIDEQEYYVIEIDNSLFRQATYTKEYTIVMPKLRYEQRIKDTLSNFKQFRPGVAEQTIRWEVYADNAPPQLGSVQLKDIPLLARNYQVIPS